jgi:pyruvate kinase
MRKTKILCTLGPASESPEMIGKLLDAGMNAVRINFSHGTHEEHARTIDRVRHASHGRDRRVPIVADLQGPKIRTGKLRGGAPVELRSGKTLTLTSRTVIGSSKRVSIDYPDLAGDVKVGDRILLADGKVELRVAKVSGDDVVCDIQNDGELGERKGVNVPGAALKLPSITAKDEKDLAFALSHEVDYIAQSFVRRAEDIRLTKKLIKRHGADTHVIAKLEKPQALDHLSDILKTADAVMVARGDLGVELSPWKVPMAQKRIIADAAQMRIPVITATQMLESMIRDPSPTRAEASDVANAVLDGSDALMLSGETAVGKYPLESVWTMARIIEAAEENLPGADLLLRRAPGVGGDLSGEVARSAARLAQELGACYIVVYTESGYTARLVSKYRPNCSILGLSRHPTVCQRMKLLWGVRAKPIHQVRDIDELVAAVESMLAELHWVKPGDLICIVAGTPFEVRGKTDLIKLHRIGEKTSAA